MTDATIPAGRASAQSVVAIRTHRWDGPSRRLHAELSAAGLSPVVVFHGHDPESAGVPQPYVRLTDRWVQRHGLRATSDWGWRCGDYFYYALRGRGPQAEYYWLVEPDAHNTRDWRAFFAAFDGRTEDAFGLDPVVPQPGHPFLKGVRRRGALSAVFPLTRLSGRAIDYLFRQRRLYSSRSVDDVVFANDELFVFTWLSAAGRFSVGNLRDVAPDYFEGTHFVPNPDIIADSLTRRPRGLYHPVRERDDYHREIGRRIARLPRIRGILGPSLADLTAADAAVIGGVFAQELSSQLHAAAPHPAPAREIGHGAT